MRIPALFLILLCTAACASEHAQIWTPKPPPLEFLGAWGNQGDGPGKLSFPLSMATDEVGSVYVADAGSGFIHKFEVTGTPLQSFEDGRLKKPMGIAVDRGGAIYAADIYRSSVIVFFPDGSRLREIFGGPKSRFKLAEGVAVDAEGFIYVSEHDGNRVQKFTDKGRFVTAWGKEGAAPGEFLTPRDVAVGQDNFIYVLDSGGTRVQKFTREGEFVTAMGTALSKPEVEGRISGLTVTDKYVFVADGRDHVLRVWTLDGRFVLEDNLGGRLMYEPMRAAPVDVAVIHGKELLLLDLSGHRVLRFRINF